MDAMNATVKSGECGGRTVFWWSCESCGKRTVYEFSTQEPAERGAKTHNTRSHRAQEAK